MTCIFCIIWRVNNFDKSYIRCVVASRDIAAGELLLEDYPAVYGPKDQYLGRYHIQSDRISAEKIFHIVYLPYGVKFYQFILDNDKSLGNKCVQCLQSNNLRKCDRCQLFFCDENIAHKQPTLECNINDVRVDGRSFVCRDLHTEECDLIIQLKATVCKLVVDQTNIDLKNQHHDCDER